MDEADLLMDRPPGGWDDIVTKDHLDLRLEALEHKLMGAFHQEMVVQTWRLIGAMTALVAAFTAAIKL